MKTWVRLFLCAAPVAFVLGCPFRAQQCSVDADCTATEVCTNGQCVADNTNDNGNTNGNDNGNTNGNDNGTGGGGDAVAGQAFFTANGCAVCHGADATGVIGPNLRSVTAADIFARLSGAESHPGGTVAGVTEQDAADVQAWLASL